MHSHFGKQTGNPFYVYVGNSLMIDPTFFNTQTKEVINQRGMKANPQFYTKEILKNLESSHQR